MSAVHALRPARTPAARAVPADDDGRPAWIDRAVGYGVVPRLFGAPPLRAVTARLDDLRDLGVDFLWLSPVTASPPDDFGYAVTDYLEVNPALGTKADMRALVDETHARGMRVIVDFVPNHTSVEHPFFVDAERRGEASPYWDFYDRDARGAATTYFDWKHLPNLNYANRDVQRFITEAFSFWVRELDVDGFRVDAAWGVKRRAPDYWPEWRRALRRLKPDLLLLAEASARDPYYVTHGFDAAYDWTDDLGHWAWEHVWDGDESTIATRLHDALANGPGGGYHARSCTLRFLNNNDTGERFLDRHGVELTKVATAALFTVPGIPMLFTGDEVGARYHPYRDSAPLSFRDESGLVPFHRRVIAIRKRHAALGAGAAFHPLDAGATSGMLAFVRHRDGAEPVLVVLNPTRRAGPLAVELPDRFGPLAAGGALRDLLTHAVEEVGGPGRLSVPARAREAKILVAEGGGS
jgi:cyclomaltodextrinase / maltogenic alpha-amylase / neopullulanase